MTKLISVGTMLALVCGLGWFARTPRGRQPPPAACAPRQCVLADSVESAVTPASTVNERSADDLPAPAEADDEPATRSPASPELAARRELFAKVYVKFQEAPDRFVASELATLSVASIMDAIGTAEIDDHTPVGGRDWRRGSDFVLEYEGRRYWIAGADFPAYAELQRSLGRGASRPPADDELVAARSPAASDVLKPQLIEDLDLLAREALTYLNR